MTNRLEEISSRVEAATPGPWRTVRNNAMGETWFNIFAKGDNDVLAMIGDCADKVLLSPNAELIAHSPQDLRDLLSVVKLMQGALEDIRERTKDPRKMNGSAFMLSDSALSEANELLNRGKA